MRPPFRHSRIGWSYGKTIALLQGSVVTSDALAERCNDQFLSGLCSQPSNGDWADQKGVSVAKFNREYGRLFDAPLPITAEEWRHAKCRRQCADEA